MTKLDLRGKPKYDCVFFSPHLDDAILSCGGLISKLIHGGEKILIITIFTNGQDKEISDAAIRYLHESGFSNAREMFRVRRGEDRIACKCLGADYLHLPFVDAIFRPASSDIFSKKSRDDDAALEKEIYYVLSAIISMNGNKNARLYFPSAIGGHVDHWLIHSIGLRMKNDKIFFWEDYPYSQHLSWRQKFEAGGSSPEFLLEDVSGLVDKKSMAIRCYKSQMPSLFGRKPLYIHPFEKYFKLRTEPAHDKKKRLLFVSDELGGGAKNANDHFFSELLKNKVFACDYYTQVSPNFTGLLANTRLLFWKIGNFIYFANRIEIAPDVVFTTSILFLFAMRLRRIIKGHKTTRILYYCHSDNYIDFLSSVTKMSFFRGGVRRFYLWFANRISQWAIKLPNIVLTPSDRYKYHLATKFKMPADKIRVVPGGVDPVFKPGKKSKNISILYSGRLDEGKGIDLLIESLKYVSTADRLDLVIMFSRLTESNRSFFHRLKRLASQKKGGGHRVRFLSPKNQKGVVSGYQRTTCVVLPSRSENFPLCLLESLASGTLFIGSRTGAIPEILSQIDPNLILEDLSSKSIARSIDYVLNLTKKQRNNITAKGIRLARKFTWEKTGEIISSLCLE